MVRFPRVRRFAGDGDADDLDVVMLTGEQRTKSRIALEFVSRR